MSALPDSDDDFDSFDMMEIENRLSFAVGYAFQRTYLEEDEFTRQLAILLGLLTKKQKKFQTFNIGDAANMFLGTAYRAARTSRLIFEEAQIRLDNPRLYGKLMLVHHDLVDGVTHPLYTLMNFFKQAAVLNVLRVDAQSVSKCFSDAFGENFSDARHSFAHEDERMVIKEDGNEAVVSRINRTQFRGTTGSGTSGLHTRHLDGTPFNIDFSKENFLTLLISISKLIEK